MAIIIIPYRAGMFNGNITFFGKKLDTEAQRHRGTEEQEHKAKVKREKG